MAAAGPTDQADQVERPKVVVAGIEIDSPAKVVASSVAGYCLVDTVTYTEIPSTFKINHYSENIYAIV